MDRRQIAIHLFDAKIEVLAFALTCSTVQIEAGPFILNAGRRSISPTGLPPPARTAAKAAQTTSASLQIGAVRPLLGAIIGINPFDQPDVEAGKVRPAR